MNVLQRDWNPEMSSHPCRFDESLSQSKQVKYLDESSLSEGLYYPEIENVNKLKQIKITGYITRHRRFCFMVRTMLVLKSFHLVKVLQKCSISLSSPERSLKCSTSYTPDHVSDK